MKKKIVVFATTNMPLITAHKSCQQDFDEDRWICREVSAQVKGVHLVDKSICERCTSELIEYMTTAAREGVQRKAESGAKEPYKELSLLDMTEMFLASVAQAAKTRFKKVSKAEYIERLMCCPTCRASKRCPYCGCYLKGEKFSKAVLASQSGCPSPDNEIYKKHLRIFPPRNYWQVCKESTTVIMFARNEKYVNRTVCNLLETATGKVQIIVVCDGCDYELPNHSQVTKVRYAKPVGKRFAANEQAKKATSEYLFFCDAHIKMQRGWDTKLKCACSSKSVAVPMIRPLDEETFEFSDTVTGGVTLLNADLREVWSDCQDKEQIEVLRPTLAFQGMAWMIRADYYHVLGGFDESLGQWGYEGSEIATKVWLNEKSPGIIILRTDLICGHVFFTNAHDKLFTAHRVSPDFFKRHQYALYGEKKIKSLLANWGLAG